MPGLLNQDFNSRVAAGPWQDTGSDSWFNIFIVMGSISATIILFLVLYCTEHQKSKEQEMTTVLLAIKLYQNYWAEADWHQVEYKIQNISFFRYCFTR